MYRCIKDAITRDVVFLRLQFSARYNVLDIPLPVPAFELTSQVVRVDSSDGCARRQLNVCAKYLLTDGYSNMAVISAKMVSGWIPDKSSIKDVSLA